MSRRRSEPSREAGATDTAAASGLACPNCQGRLQIPEGVRIIRCPFCDLRSLVRGDRGVRRYQVRRQLSRQQALEKMRGFLRGLDRAPGLAQRAEFSDLFVVYLPFWSLWAEVGAWIFGKKEVGSSKNRRLEPREVKLVGTRSWNQAACDVHEFGVQDISLGGQELLAFEPGALHADGMVFEPVSAEAEARAAALAAIEQEVVDDARLDRIGSTHIQRIRERRALVYYPLWVGRYVHRDRGYQVVLDGATGQVLYGKVPGNVWFRAAALVAGFALGAALLVDGTALALQVVAASDDSDAVGLLCLPVILGGVVLLAAYRRFRFGELLEHRLSFRRKRREPSALTGSLRVWGDLSQEFLGSRK